MAAKKKKRRAPAPVAVDVPARYDVEQARLQYLGWRSKADPSMRRIWFPVEMFVWEQVAEFARWVEHIAVVGTDPRDGEEFPPEVRQAAAHVYVRLAASHAVS